MFGCIWQCLVLSLFYWILNVLKVQHLETEIEKLSIRSSPLGKDRQYSRYWFFKREGRLFVETADSREWGYYSTKEEVTDDLVVNLYFHHLWLLKYFLCVEMTA
jgi:hypothetical protein